MDKSAIKPGIRVKISRAIDDWRPRKGTVKSYCKASEAARVSPDDDPMRWIVCYQDEIEEIVDKTETVVTKKGRDCSCGDPLHGNYCNRCAVFYFPNTESEVTDEEEK